MLLPFLLVLLLGKFETHLADSYEKQLFSELLHPDYYNSLARPVKNSNDSVLVHLGLILQQILDVVSDY